MGDITSMDDYKIKRGMNLDHQKRASKRQDKEELNKRFQEESHQALKNLGSNAKLDEKDRCTIARRLYREVEKLLRVTPGLKKYEICKKAGFLKGYNTSQMLAYLTLPPDVDPEERRLQTRSAPYRRLIKALSELSGVPLLRLADEMTIGTHLHPLFDYTGDGADDPDSPEVLLATLQEASDRIDRKFGVFELFRQTADIKVNRMKRGAKVFWPFCRPDRQSLQQKSELRREDTFWQRSFEDEIYTKDGEYIHAYNEISGLNPDDLFLPFVPHVYLGTRFTLNDLETMAEDRYLWPYSDNCGSECPCVGCNDLDPCLPWERGNDRSGWAWCLEQDANQVDKCSAQMEMGKRLLKILEEPLRFERYDNEENRATMLVDGRSLTEISKSMELERIKMFEECKQIIHPEQAYEFIRYQVRYHEQWPQWSEMLKAVGRMVEEQYSGDYQEFTKQFHNSLLTRKWKKILQDLIDETTSELAGFERYHPSTVWLVIYPSPEFNGLVPSLYSTNREGVGELLVLSTRLLSEMSKGEISCSMLDPIIGPDGDEFSLYERIRELVSGEDGVVIHQEWERTAEFLKNNPILADMDAQRRRLKEFWENDSTK